jgi:glycosyltransferase involved in cell wall biosynthesis
MPKVLFIATHRPNRSPSQRFRFEQYLSFLKQNDWDCDFSYLISEKADKVFYKKGHFLQKILITLNAFFIRLINLMNVSKYDLIFIQREAFFTGTTFFEKRFSKSNAKIIFDYDDSIWLSNVSDANKKWEWLKNANKTKDIIALSDMIFAGNQYLADYAKQVNNNIYIIPTTIDTNEYNKIPQTNKKQICIGWSGSITTIQHFEYAIDSFIAIQEKYQDKVCFKVIGDNQYKNERLGITGLAWKKETEIEELSSFDIGIMPLPNDEWASGKCGLKGLQYMALEIPTIMSPVGVNNEIIQNGKNGFLAESKKEWIEAISQLIESETLRKELGQNARKTVLEKYSVEANKEKYLNCFNSLLD